MLKSTVSVVLHVLMRGPTCRKHGIASIGICIGSPDTPKVLYRGRYDMLPYDYQEHDKKFVLPAEITRSALPPSDQVRALYKLLLAWEKKYDLYIACENASQTAAAIDRYLEFEDLPSLHCKWRVHDITSYARGLKKVAWNVKEVEVEVKGDLSEHHYLRHQSDLMLAKKGDSVE